MALPDLQPIFSLDIAEAPVLESSVHIRVGSRYTQAFHGAQDRAVLSRALPHSPVVLAATQAEAARASGVATARLVRAAARQVAERAGLEGLALLASPVVAVGSIARAVITVGGGGRDTITVAQLQSTIEKFAVAWVARRRGMPFQRFLDPMLIGAAMLEATLQCLETNEIAAHHSHPEPGPASSF